MKSSVRILLFLASLALVSGCAYGHYLGMHGPSIQARPEVHVNVSSDAECLQCHHPDKNPSGPPTSHPQFKGCLKCHNDLP
jgi:hypothetical protein